MELGCSRVESETGLAVGCLPLAEAVDAARDIVREIRRGEIPAPDPAAARAAPEFALITRDDLILDAEEEVE